VAAADIIDGTNWPCIAKYSPGLGELATNLAEHCIKKVEVVEYPELGMEAIWRIEVEDFPALIIIDDKGNDFFKELNLG
jgi:fumarate hydratase class I